MKKVFLPIVLCVATLCFTMCDGLNLTNPKIAVSTPEFTSMVHVDVVDAKTNQFLRIPVTLNVAGENAVLVSNNIGISQNEYETTVGMFDLGINISTSDITATNAAAKFNITVKADGYRTVTQNVFVNKEGKNTLRINLIKLNDAPEGVTVVINNNFASASNGAVTETVTEKLNGGAQELTLTENTVLRNASGQPISGTLKAEILYYDPSSENAQNAFPGSRNVTVDNGVQGEFTSAGMFSVSLTAGGETVKTFENGALTLKTIVPDGLLNADGEAMKAGDQIDFWSIDEGSGQWTKEKTSTVISENGQLVLIENVSHLSTWNWDTFASYDCYQGPRFRFVADPSTPNVKPFNVQIKLNSQYAPYQGKTFTDYISIGDPYSGYYDVHYVKNINQLTTFTFEYAVNDGRTLEFITPTGSKNVTLTNLCDAGYFDIRVKETTPIQEEITVNFDFKATAVSDTNLVIKPNFWAYYVDYSNFYTYYNTFYLSNGKGSIVLTNNKTYEIICCVGNYWRYANIKVVKNGNGTATVTAVPTYNFADLNVADPVDLVVPITADNQINFTYHIIVPDNIYNNLK